MFVVPLRLFALPTVAQCGCGEDEIRIDSLILILRTCCLCQSLLEGVFLFRCWCLDFPAFFIRARWQIQDVLAGRARACLGGWVVGRVVLIPLFGIHSSKICEFGIVWGFSCGAGGLIVGKSLPK